MNKHIGVLLINLGTPDLATPRAVKRYLTEFLTDRRVIDLPYFFRQLLVRGIIVPKRYRNSTKLYQSIWREDGSPLKIYQNQVVKKLQEALGDAFSIEPAMRYQNPSIQTGIEKLRGVKKLMIVPLFPQYASATTGSIYQEVFRILQRWETIPSLICINEFATHPDVIQAFCHSASQYNLSHYDHFIFSYHGLPTKHIQKADCFNRCLKEPNCCEKLTEKNQTCYAAQCASTTRAICQELNLPNDCISHCYQSRLGKDPWLRPYTIDTLKELAKAGKKKILVFSPAFVADCLETLQEIGIEYRSAFKSWGGEQLDLVKGLNTQPNWISALKQLILEHLPH